MTRKTVSINYLLDQHKNKAASVFVDPKMTNEEKILVLQTINSEIENTLMVHNRYRGFQYVNVDYRKMIQNGIKPGQDSYWVMLENYHQYY